MKLFNYDSCCAYQVIHELTLSHEELTIDIVKEAFHPSLSEVKHQSQSKLSELVDRKIKLVRAIEEQEERIRNLEIKVVELNKLLKEK